MWTSWEGVGKVWELDFCLVPRSCARSVWAEKMGLLWAVHQRGADLHILSSDNLGAVPATAQVNACCSPRHPPGVVRICACMGVFLRTGYDCHSRGSPLIGTTPGLWLSKASTNKEWNMLGREAGVLMGSGGQVKEHKFFPIPFSPGGHWPRDCGIQKGGGVWRLGYLVWCWFSNPWSFSRMVPLGTMVCGMFLGPFLIAWGLCFAFLRSPRTGPFPLYLLFPVLSCYHCDIWDRAYFNTLLPVTQLTHNPKHFCPDSYYREIDMGKKRKTKPKHRSVAKLRGLLKALVK